MARALEETASGVILNTQSVGICLLPTVATCKWQVKIGRMSWHDLSTPSTRSIRCALSFPRNSSASIAPYSGTMHLATLAPMMLTILSLILDSNSGRTIKLLGLIAITRAAVPDTLVTLERSFGIVQMSRWWLGVLPASSQLQ